MLPQTKPNLFYIKLRGCGILPGILTEEKCSSTLPHVLAGTFGSSCIYLCKTRRYSGSSALLPAQKPMMRAY